MRVFVTGATGFIGSAVVQSLLAAGHDVLGLARSDASAAKLQAAGAQVHRGDIEDLESLRRGAAQAQAAVHTAFFHEISHPRLSTRVRVFLGGAPTGIVGRFMQAAVDADRRAIETIGGALQGDDRAIIAAFGTLAMRAGQPATEDDSIDPQSVGGPRGQTEDAILGLNARGIRASVIRLPPIVHGDADPGFAARFVRIARKNGRSAYIGDGKNRWPSVHRLDAARLFRLALENGSGGLRYHAVADEGVPFIEIANVISRRLNVPAVSITKKEAAKVFSWLSTFMPIDNPASSAVTKARLSWQPEYSDLLADLEHGTYFREIS